MKKLLISAAAVLALAGPASAKLDGIKDITFHAPQISMEQVDLSFDYPRCSKDYKRVLGIKIPYMHCEKTRMVLKFGVPRIEWKTTSIKLPYIPDSKEAAQLIQNSLIALENALRDAIREFDRAETILLAQISAAQASDVPASVIVAMTNDLKTLQSEEAKVVSELRASIAELQAEA